jgi:hypothetical protein
MEPQGEGRIRIRTPNSVGDAVVARAGLIDPIRGPVGRIDVERRKSSGASDFRRRSGRVDAGVIRAGQRCRRCATDR